MKRSKKPADPVTSPTTVNSECPLLLLPVGKLILFLSLPTLFQALMKILPKWTDSTGHKSGPDSAPVTIYKTGTISACQRSVQLPSPNNSAAFLLTRPRFSKWISCLFYDSQHWNGSFTVWSSNANNNLQQPFLISSQDDLSHLYKQLEAIDILERICQQRPNTKRVVDLVTNVSFGSYGNFVIIRPVAINFHWVISPKMRNWHAGKQLQNS